MQNDSANNSYRVQSIDIIRGLVMIIMALDHVREFFYVDGIAGNPTNMATTTPLLFFTRWITHFCAPVFVFLSGTSAFLAAQKKTPNETRNFLIKRGLWLVVAEMLIITLGLTFNPLYNFIIWQVIWAIGWSMVILGVLIKLPVSVIAIIGFLLVAAHNVTDYMNLPKEGPLSVALNILVTTRGSFYPLGGNYVIGDFYAILPWTGVMLLGYALGKLFTSSVGIEKRKKKLLTMGAATITLFIVLRLINGYGDPAPWSHQKNAIFTLLSFLNTTKYPCSLQYVCMTLGPAIILLAVTERMQNAVTNVFRVYGRVPFFYYVLHFYLIHSLLVILFFVSGYTSKDIVDPNVPFLFRPLQFGFSIWVAYFIWMSVVAILYRPCKWFYRYKQTHHQWWLSYI